MIMILHVIITWNPPSLSQVKFSREIHKKIYFRVQLDSFQGKMDSRFHAALTRPSAAKYRMHRKIFVL